MNEIYLRRSDTLNPPPNRTKRQESDDVRKHIEAFFARGGQIQKVPAGASAVPEGAKQAVVINAQREPSCLPE